MIVETKQILLCCSILSLLRFDVACMCSDRITSASDASSDDIPIDIDTTKILTPNKYAIPFRSMASFVVDEQHDHIYGFGHDGIIRRWNLRNVTIEQEIDLKGVIKKYTRDMGNYVLSLVNNKLYLFVELDMLTALHIEFESIPELSQYRTVHLLQPKEYKLLYYVDLLNSSYCFREDNLLLLSSMFTDNSSEGLLAAYISEVNTVEVANLGSLKSGCHQLSACGSRDNQKELVGLMKCTDGIYLYSTKDDHHTLTTSSGVVRHTMHNIYNANFDIILSLGSTSEGWIVSDAKTLATLADNIYKYGLFRYIEPISREQMAVMMYTEITSYNIGILDTKTNTLVAEYYERNMSPDRRLQYSPLTSTLYGSASNYFLTFNLKGE